MEFSFSRFVLSTSVAAALLAGCAAAKPLIGAPGTTPQSRLIAAHADRSGSWMLPETKSNSLLYLAGDGPNVYVYSYPAGVLVGTLTGFGAALYECSDTAGDVFITSVEGSEQGIYEYAHGGSEPINFLPLEGAWACSVDAATGDLAVIQEYGGNVYVYENGEGTPTVYNDANLYMSRSVAYDAAGNLFIDGEYETNSFALVELPRGSDTFKDINLQGSFNGDPYQPIAWDGKYLGLGSLQIVRRRQASVEVVNRIQISGSTGTVVGVAPLAYQHDAFYPQFVIHNGVAIDPSDNHNGSYFAYFKYPGGKQTKKVKLPGAYDIVGAALSISSSQR